MRVIRYAGVMLAVGLVWAVVGAILRTLGFGQGATVAVGFVLLFFLSPVLMALASGSPSNSATPPDPGIGEVDTPKE